MIETSEEQGQRPQPPAPVAPDPGPAPGQGTHSRGLLAIGLFKLAKALFFFAVGVAALHLIHSNVGELLLRTTSVLHLDPDGRFVEMLQDKADLISGHKLRQVSILTFLYSALSLVEGIGLMKEKKWAEYLTLALTIGALPWDLTELAKDPTPIRGGVVVINLLVLAYLLWFLRMHRKHARESSAAAV